MPFNFYGAGDSDLSTKLSRCAIFWFSLAALSVLIMFVSLFMAGYYTPHHAPPMSDET